MSQRNRLEEPGSRLAKPERQAGHRHVRRAANITLGVDPDAAVLPLDPVAAGRRASQGVVAKSPCGEVRHWKMPFWKRRTTLRHERAVAERHAGD